MIVSPRKPMATPDAAVATVSDFPEQTRADLQDLGWTILAENIKTRKGVVDMVMRREDVVVFGSFGMLGERGKSRTRSAAVAWMAANPKAIRGALRFRFDVFTADAWIRDAF